MKRFNKDAAIRKLRNKNNSRLKIASIIFSVVILVVAIIYFSFALYTDNTSFSLIDGVIAVNGEFISVKDKMITLASSGSSDLEYDGIDSLGEYGTNDNNLRYVGSKPNNYIYFNCSTTEPSEMNDSTCEKWRIIGLMNNVEDSNGDISSRIKIIRATALGNYSWDSSEENINRGMGINQWAESTYENGTYYEGADLMRELNTDYLGNITVGTDGKWYTTSKNVKNADMPASTLNQNAQNMIQNIKWNIGSNANSASSLWKTKNMYDYERSDNTSKLCTQSGLYCNDKIVRTTTWTGKVALMYPSDYGYSTSGNETTSKATCLNTSLNYWDENEFNACPYNTWLFDPVGSNWTLTPSSNTDWQSGVFYMYSLGYISRTSSDVNIGVRPVVFLKNNVLIFSGDGSSTKPYKLVQTTNVQEKMTTLASEGATDLEYDGVDTLGEYGTADNNLRYIGATPSNYIYFNCNTSNPNKMNDTTCEKWRIVGLMNNIEDALGNTASRVKIMRNDSFGKYVWDTSTTSVNNGAGVNQWGESTYENGTTYEGADLMRELNTDYLGNITVGTDGKWYNGFENAKGANMPTSTLNQNAQNMIQDVKWNTGAVIFNNTDRYVKSVYENERSNTTGKTCTSGTFCNDTVLRTLTWVGKVALMYPSDYGYSTSGGLTTNKETCLSTRFYNWSDSGMSDCKSNSWIYDSNNWQLTISPSILSTSSIGEIFIFNDGPIGITDSSNKGTVRPSLFLKNNVMIYSGEGSESNPYKLVLVE